MAVYLYKTIPLNLLMHLLQRGQVFFYREIADLPGDCFQVIDNGTRVIKAGDGPCLGLFKDLETSLLQFAHGIRQVPLWTNVAG